MTSATKRWIRSAFIALAALGFLLPFWPLSIIALACMAAWGSWFTAIAVGLLLDLAWGAPVGLSQYFFFPFTLAAVLLCLARVVASLYLIDRNLQEHL